MVKRLWYAREAKQISLLSFILLGELIGMVMVCYNITYLHTIPVKSLS